MAIETMRPIIRFPPAQNSRRADVTTSRKPEAIGGEEVVDRFPASPLLEPVGSRSESGKITSELPVHSGATNAPHWLSIPPMAYCSVFLAAASFASSL